MVVEAQIVSAPRQFKFLGDPRRVSAGLICGTFPILGIDDGPALTIASFSQRPFVAKPPRDNAGGLRVDHRAPVLNLGCQTQFQQFGLCEYSSLARRR
jgi:hypothetical protein